MRTRVPIMSKREALKYAESYYNDETRRERKYPLCKEFLVKKAVQTAASELLGKYADEVYFNREGKVLAMPSGAFFRLVSVSQRFVTLETV